ncbi:serine hydrolase domain-containing protein [Nocardia crassostreae]|uniref:serine hydrolase domain-containing protein n=1 Tax=Nocardia crassostreae TaxID=53428 RepID=UPI000A8EB3A3|nr:serine hydrolase domain-containing protein [Nocardia crassostreae]
MHDLAHLGLSERIGAILNRHAAVGLAAGVVRGGELESFAAHGVADIAEQRPISPDAVFRIASITKTFTAVALMQLCERGLVDPDAPAHDYLRSYRLTAAGFRPPTIRQLLTHTSGLGETLGPAQLLRPDFGESVDPGRRMPTLSEYYGGELRVRAEPGTRWIYTDHGFATLGQIIADVTGTDLPNYLRDNIFRPLGMTSTDLGIWHTPRSRLATGYTLRARGPRAVVHREMVTAGASAAYSTMADMARYAAALLGGGANTHGTVLRPDTVATMFAPQYRPEVRLPGMGLAFFRQDLGGHAVVEHQDILPGFDSQLWLALDDGIGVIVFATGAHRGMLWLPAETSHLLGGLLGVPEPAINPAVPHRPAVWPAICGRYRMAGSLSDIRARLTFGAGVDVRIRRGIPILRILTPIPALLHGIPLHPDDEKDPLAFRIDLSEFGLGTACILFDTAAPSSATTLRNDLLPMTLHRTRS